MAKISIIIPCYKVEQYLPECLDSVINQTFKDWEAICVDDGSPDNCGKILDDYAKNDNRIKVIHKENGGVSSARNAGLDVATGEWVSFVDADDYIGSDFYKSIIEQENTRADVLQFGYKTVGAAKNDIVEYKREDLCCFDKIISSINKCYTWNKLWKREFLNKNNIRFVEGISFCEDMLFTVQSVISSRVWTNITNSGYFYRYREGSVSNDKTKQNKRKQDKYNVARLTMKLVDQACLSKEQVKILKDFAIEQLVFNEDVTDKKVYHQYLDLFGTNENLIKKRRKAVKKWLFSFSLRKKRCVILGRNLWVRRGNENAA